MIAHVKSTPYDAQRFFVEKTPWPDGVVHNPLSPSGYSLKQSHRLETLFSGEWVVRSRMGGDVHGVSDKEFRSRFELEDSMISVGMTVKSVTLSSRTFAGPSDHEVVLEDAMGKRLEIVVSGEEEKSALLPGKRVRVAVIVEDEKA